MKKAFVMLLMVVVAGLSFATGVVEYSDPIDTARGAGSFNTLLAAVDAAGLTDTLRGSGPFTIFAPTDAAFAALPAGLVDALLADTDALTAVLLYHVVPRDVRSGEVVSTSGAATLQGETVGFSVRSGAAYADDARVVTADITTSNGTIHAIDSVLVPSSVNVAKLLADDIVDTAVADGRFTTLVTAVQAAGLEATLRGDGPFTVFAPTDAAFAALPAGTVAALLRDIPRLSNILLYHVVGAEVYAADVVELTSATTVQGQPVAITVSGGNVFVNNAQVIITDVQASNGVIHVIDTVILPPADNIAATLQADGRFTTLLTAVQAAGLADTLSTGGPFTLFAPTDAAFARLPVGTVQSLLADIPTLSDILLYHVVEGRVFSGDVVGLSSAPTVQGDSIAISISGGSVRLNADSTVTGVNTLATNGVIHVIDRVILPPGN
ncbi:MAG: fasciclin domain-containing protein [Spirochaetaceae bacterium]|nr:MAG: fasciclin domain-containing protein [Spirochaetaceae bacterium]